MINKLKITGYAAIFRTPYSDGDIIEPGAFKEAVANFLAGEDLPVLYGFDSKNGVVAKVADMEEDAIGLKVSFTIPEELDGNNEAVPMLVQRGSLSDLSIGYRVGKKDNRSEGSRPTLKDIDLFSIGLVHNSSHPNTKILEVQKVKRRKD